MEIKNVVQQRRKVPYKPQNVAKNTSIYVYRLSHSVSTKSIKYEIAIENDASHL